jgi:1-phosphofructokinase
MNPEFFEVVTVTLNSAIDRTVSIANFTAGAVNRVETVHSSAGGKGVNVAARLAESGLRVAVTGFLGRENPALFEDLFALRAIADRFIRIPGQTRVGIKVVDPELGQTTDINFPGSQVSLDHIAALSKEISLLDASVFVLAGSLPPGVEPTYYRDLTAKLRQRGARVVLDASGEALRLALEARPHLIKPNADELGEMLGRKLDDEAAIITAARELVATGIEMVVVSMGSAGACFVTAKETVIARPPQVEVRSTVGAGDAMVAGLVAAHSQELPLADAARMATAFSVHALTRDNGAPFSQSIQQLIPLVTLDPLQ